MEECRHKAIGLIVDKDGCFLVGRYKRNTFDGKIWWSFPGGGLDEGEDYIDAAYREIYEEVGIKRDQLQLIYEYKDLRYEKFSKEHIERCRKYIDRAIRQKAEKYFVFTYSGLRGSIDLEIFNEFVECKWVKPNDLDKYIDQTRLDFLDIKKLESFIDI